MNTPPQPEDYGSQSEYLYALRMFRKQHTEPDDWEDDRYDGDCDYWTSGCYGKG